ncbi:MAG TPA: molecular chaperone HtpG [Clostridiales bacterium]|nr:molecular chaperone HtpG [Clostridiales bacterium]
MQKEKGNITVSTKDMLPIIKKWLYSDNDIFIRELVSNGCDAIKKFQSLVSIGEADLKEDEKYYVKIIVDKEEGTLKFIDNGIGMTEEEVKKYINQVAFSGAKDFIQKYEDKMDKEGEIIGHFGLGFYSAFMVSDLVQIDTLSYKEGAEAVRWSCDGGIEYTMEPSDRTERGTTVTLFINEDSKEYLDYYRVREVLEKYCAFLPIEIYLEDANADEKEKELQKEPINDTNPLWLKKPSECTDEEYKEFYKKVFHDFDEPLFWIHLNVDFPFNLKGILYFPRIKHEFDTLEGRVKLYCNQVFVADNIKEVIPEYLLLLKGVIDCPDLPLNVSRSFLQNDPYVRKVSSHITKKVADKLISLYENERENYNKYWDDINPFIKYGCMQDYSFYDQLKDVIIYKTIDDRYITLEEYLKESEDRHKGKVYYVTDINQQAQYINLFKQQGLNAVILDSPIDNAFIQFLENQNRDVKFYRIDSHIADSVKADKKGLDKTERKVLKTIFKKALDDKDIKIEVESLKTDSVPAIMLLAEESRRIKDFSRQFGIDLGSMPEGKEQTLVINDNNALIKLLPALNANEANKADVELICRQVYDLAMLGHEPLEPEEMTEFIDRSNELLLRFAQLERE